MRPNPSIFEEVIIEDLNTQSVPDYILRPTPEVRIQGNEVAPEWSPLERPVKEWTRHILAQSLQGKAPKKVALVLPSSTGRDIDVLKHYNVVAKNCTWIWAERDEKVANYFATNANASGLFSEEEQVFEHRDDLNTLLAPLPVDLAWFDLYGNITWEDLNFYTKIFRFDTSTPEASDIFFTFAARGAWRGGGGFGTSTPLLKLMLNSLLDFDTLGPRFKIDTEMLVEYEKLKSSTSPRDQECEVGPMQRPVITRSCALDDVILTQIQLFKYIFTSYRKLDFDCKAYIYQDAKHHEMVLYHLSNFRTSVNAIKYFAKSPIDTLITLYENKDKDDATLTALANKFIKEKTDQANVELLVSDVRRWRLLNKLPLPGEADEFDFAAELEENLFNTVDDWPESIQLNIEDLGLPPEEQVKKHTKELREMLRSELYEFLPLLRKGNKAGSNITIEGIPHGLRIFTPVSPKFGQNYYQITFGSRTVIANPQSIELIPQFFHEANRNGLQALFRIIFMGDPYLHPQLCHKIDRNCSAFTDPQLTALAKWVDSWNAKEKAGVIVLPTGMGKTTVAVEIARSFLTGQHFGGKVRRPQQKQPRILFLGGQAEILDQAVKSFLNPQIGSSFLTPDDIGVFYSASYSEDVIKIQNDKGGWQSQDGKLNNLLAKVVFSTIQSFRSSMHLMQEDPNAFTLIIVDEAHHSAAETWNEILKYVQREYLLGLTATPFRMDEKPALAAYENRTLYSVILNRGIYLGYLVWPEYKIFKDQTRYLKKVKKQAQIDEADYQEEIIKKFLEHIRHLKTVVFCRDVESAKDWVEIFKTRLKISAESLHDETPANQRKAILDKFKKGEIQVLFVKDLLNEGVDVPDIEAIMFLRKTESAIRQLQQLGRGLRLADGKRKLVVLDFTSNYESVKLLLETMKLLGYKLRRGGGGGGGGPIPPTAGIPKAKFTLDDAADLFIQNSLEKETEIQLANYIQDKRLQGVRLWQLETDTDPVIRGASQSTIERVTKEVDSKMSYSSEMQLLRDQTVFYETVESAFHAGISRQNAFEMFRVAEATKPLFDYYWNCIEQKTAKSECISTMVKRLSKKIIKRRR